MINRDEALQLLEKYNPELLREGGVSEDVIHAVASHGYF